MPSVAFKQVDVFTTQPFKGNPVAVVMDGASLSTAQMQAIANWTNLSETTFVLPAERSQADYRVRIFTPNSELPFAGHPTIGTAYALLEAGIISANQGRIVQECGAGLINLTVQEMPAGSYSIAFELPEPVITLLDDAQIDRLERILGISVDRQLTPALIDVGARWIVAHVGDAASVLTIQPDFAHMQIQDRDMQITGVTIYGSYPEQNNARIEVRSFAPAHGINEDPVCGSGNGSVAAFIRYHGLKLPDNTMIQSTQGIMVGRQGQIELQILPDQIIVGGSAVTCIDGVITL